MYLAQVIWMKKEESNGVTLTKKPLRNFYDIATFLSANLFTSLLNVTITTKWEIQHIKTKNSIYRFLYRNTKCEPYSEAMFLSILKMLAALLIKEIIQTIEIYDDLNVNNKHVV